MRTLKNLLDLWRRYVLKSTTVTLELDDLSVSAALAAAIPAGATLLGVSMRVTTPIVTSGATNTVDLGITGGDADAFGAAIAGALNTVSDETDYTVAPGTLWAATAQGLTVTPPGVETFVSGAVKVVVTYAQAVQPAA